jgi:hypothetical protein
MCHIIWHGEVKQVGHANASEVVLCTIQGPAEKPDNF